MSSADISTFRCSRQPDGTDSQKQIVSPLVIGMTSDCIVGQLICSVKADERVPEPTGSYLPDESGSFTALSRLLNTIRPAPWHAHRRGTTARGSGGWAGERPSRGALHASCAVGGRLSGQGSSNSLAASSKDRPTRRKGGVVYENTTTLSVGISTFYSRSQKSGLRA